MLTGYQESLIWKKLFNFQRDAATGIINKLETYSGCILADNVGLGKAGDQMWEEIYKSSQRSDPGYDARFDRGDAAVPFFLWAPASENE